METLTIILVFKRTLRHYRGLSLSLFTLAARKNTNDVRSIKMMTLKRTALRLEYWVWSNDGGRRQTHGLTHILCSQNADSIHSTHDSAYARCTCAWLSRLLSLSDLQGCRRITFICTDVSHTRLRRKVGPKQVNCLFCFIATRAVIIYVRTSAHAHIRKLKRRNALTLLNEIACWFPFREVKQT